MKYKLKYNKKINNITELLTARGITNITQFLKPTKENYIDFSLLDNMEEGYLLYKSYLEKNSLIDLIVDCDVDGYTSAAIFYLATKVFNPNIEIRYHLHNGKQHGLEDQIQELVILENLNFVVCPDSSSNDYDYHKELKEMGVNTLCLDHHEAEYYSPYAVVINNQLSDKYENKGLSGATITFKFVEYCAYRLQQDNWNINFDIEEIEKLIDLAAVGAIGDMMDVTTLENRYIFSEGLNKINNFSLRVLVDKQSFSIGDITKLSPVSIAFYIVPLINALIRVGTIQQKEVLFNSFIKGDTLIQSTKRGAKPGQMETIAEQNARNCVNARNRQKTAEEKAMDYLSMIIERDDLDKNKVLLIEIDDPDRIDSTLTGLIAMKVMNTYNKPVLLGRQSEELDEKGKPTGKVFLKGSIRNDDKSELKDFKAFLEESEMFEYIQGHANAAGFSINIKNIDKFHEYANEKLKDIDFTEGVYSVDYIYNANNDNEEIYETIESLSNLQQIWGQNMPDPYIVIEDIEINSNDIKIMGANASTLKFVYNGVEYIKFFAKDLIKQLSDRDRINITVLGHAQVNEWMGRITPQIKISDYNIRDSILDF